MKDFSIYVNQSQEVGYVEEVMHSLVYASGLPSVEPREIVAFETGEFGQILSLNREVAEIIVFSNNIVQKGTRITRTKNPLTIPVGNHLLGKTLNPFCGSFDGESIAPGTVTIRRPIETIAPGMNARQRITESLVTGVTVVDLVIPVGKGQRELVLGDRKSGKTTFLLQSMLTQARLGTICIYTAIGKKQQDIKRIEEFFAKHDIRKNTIIVAASSQESAGIIFLTPYTAMTIAEYFKDLGHHVLIVFDDLSTHAKFYRQLSLLGRRFPGRNSYPGDIFHTHSKLLERAGNFEVNGKQASITCFPVADTIQGDFTGYIQTNIMSMTDGHVYFDSDLFSKGRRPAVNTFLSVTRVGRQTQSQLLREIGRELTSFLTLLEKMQSYVHFGAELNESTKAVLTTGKTVLSFFDQQVGQTMPISMQILLFSFIWLGAWKDQDPPTLAASIQSFLTRYEEDKKFAKTVDAMIQEAPSFNGFLTKAGKFMQTLKINVKN